MKIFGDEKLAGQATRHIITGGLADLADIGFFNVFLLFIPDVFAKAFSFLVAVCIKYFGNKYWAFKKPETIEIRKEIVIFLLATAVGLAINLLSFSFFVNINTGFSVNLWRQISVIFAMGVTAIWNFLSYKFIVFKK